MSRRRSPARGRAWRGTPALETPAASSASAVAAASPTTAACTGRCAPSDSSSRSTCTTLAPRAISAPSRVVQRVSEAPKARIRSASAISRAATGEAKPPEMPTAHGEPSNSPWPMAEVASTAPIASPRRSSGSRAPARTAPRPATISGRRAAAISSATSATASGAGDGGSGSRSRPGAAPPGAGSAWTSSGRLSTTGLRSTRARRSARAVSAAAVAPEWMRSGTAPSVAARPGWSTAKFERIAARGASPASTSSGVRLLAASVRPVSAFVKPGPWWTLQTPTRPLTRA